MNKSIFVVILFAIVIAFSFGQYNIAKANDQNELVLELNTKMGPFPRIISYSNPGRGSQGSFSLINSFEIENCIFVVNTTDYVEVLNIKGLISGKERIPLNKIDVNTIKIEEIPGAFLFIMETFDKNSDIESYVITKSSNNLLNSNKKNVKSEFSISFTRGLDEREKINVMLATHLDREHIKAFSKLDVQQFREYLIEMIRMCKGNINQ